MKTFRVGGNSRPFLWCLSIPSRFYPNISIAALSGPFFYPVLFFRLKTLSLYYFNTNTCIYQKFVVPLQPKHAEKVLYNNTKEIERRKIAGGMNPFQDDFKVYSLLASTNCIYIYSNIHYMEEEVKSPFAYLLVAMNYAKAAVENGG